jgi:hypothetical protein
MLYGEQDGERFDTQLLREKSLITEITAKSNGGVPFF